MPAAAQSGNMKQADLPLLGMHCAACANRIEKALKKTPGVVEANVNYATMRASVRYDPGVVDLNALAGAVRNAGYDVVLPGSGANNGKQADSLEAKAREEEYERQLGRFRFALALAIPVGILAMTGHIFPPLERFMNFSWRPWLEMILTTSVLFHAGSEFFSGAWKAARHRAADMNTLVALGTLAAYVYSVAVTIMWKSPAHAPGHIHAAHPMAMETVYYESAAFIITLVLMGRLLEARARKKTTGATGLSGTFRWKRFARVMSCSCVRARKFRWTAR